MSTFLNKGTLLPGQIKTFKSFFTKNNPSDAEKDRKFIFSVMYHNPILLENAPGSKNKPLNASNLH